MTAHVSVLILGAGPTGLGSAYRLNERGFSDWLLLEKNDYVGGLATTFTDQKGFLWDVGGHVVHSHYDYFDQVFATHVLPHCNTLQREAWVWLADTFIPYPFQYNLHHLPTKIRAQCVAGLKKLTTQKRSSQSQNFKDWILTNFGEGIATHFLFPQNKKTWGIPLEKMSTGWVSDRVATVDLKRTLRNIELKKDDVAWGPNHVFYFPKHGGTGFIWKTIADTLPQEKLKLNCVVKKIDLKKQIVSTDSGQTYHYDTLISSLPLTTLLDLAQSKDAQLAHTHLHFSTVHVIGLGLSGQTPEQLKTKCWLYFPEKQLPFFRATVFSNYARANVPDPQNQWSLMFEMTETNQLPVQAKTVVSEVIQGALKARLIESADQVISSWHYLAELGYPIPTLSRDAVIDDLLHALQANHVYSRGRFGAWKYEVSNMDHSFMQGVEAVNHLLHHQPEVTVWWPEQVNRQ